MATTNSFDQIVDETPATQAEDAQPQRKPTLTFSPHPAPINLDRLTSFHRSSLRRAKDFGLRARLVAAQIKGTVKPVKLSNRDDLNELDDNTIVAIWVDVYSFYPDGNIRTAEQVRLAPTHVGYEGSCTCDFAAEPRTNNFTGQIEGTTCVHMMTALYSVEPEIIQEQARRWQQDDLKRRALTTRVAYYVASDDDAPVLPDV